MEAVEINRVIQSASLQDKQGLVDFLFAVQTGHISCRRAASILMEKSNSEVPYKDWLSAYRLSGKDDRGYAYPIVEAAYTRQ